MQEEGLALFLLIDAFVPDWQHRIFGSTYVSPVEMLRRLSPLADAASTTLPELLPVSIVLGLHLTEKLDELR